SVTLSDPACDMFAPEKEKPETVASSGFKMTD
ncbi:MAG: hypothetical protein ACI93T_004599, partial [Porticoccaceae bacterium]